MWDHHGHFCAALKKRGFEYLGGGRYAEVWGKPDSDKVIKVGVADDGWPAYIAWAKDNGYMGLFAPVVTSFRLFKAGLNDDCSFYVAVMERLEETIRQLAPLDPARAIWNQIRYYNTGMDEENPWKEFLRRLQLIQHEGNFYLDIHEDNGMVAKDGRIVVTDPFSTTTNSTSFTARAAEKFSRRNKETALAA